MNKIANIYSREIAELKAIIDGKYYRLLTLLDQYPEGLTITELNDRVMGKSKRGSYRLTYRYCYVLKENNIVTINIDKHRKGSPAIVKLVSGDEAKKVIEKICRGHLETIKKKLNSISNKKQVKNRVLKTVHVLFD